MSDTRDPHEQDKLEKRADQGAAKPERPLAEQQKKLDETAEARPPGKGEQRDTRPPDAKESPAIKDWADQAEVKGDRQQVNKEIGRLKEESNQLRGEKDQLQNERKQITEHWAKGESSEKRDAIRDQARLGDIHNRQLEIDHRQKEIGKQVSTLEAAKERLDQKDQDLTRRQAERDETKRR